MRRGILAMGDRLPARLGLAAVVLMQTGSLSNSQDFTFSGDTGAIVKFARSPNLALQRTICAPSPTGLCNEYAIKGVNSPGSLTLEIEGKYGQPARTVEYERIRTGLPKDLQGYAVWTTISPDAPDYLKSFKAPIARSDPTTDKYLARWNGQTSKLLDLETYAELQKAIDEIYANRGYPINDTQPAPIVVPRQDAALWEAMAIRTVGASPEITNYGGKYQRAVVATDRQTVLASVDKQDELSQYSVLSDLSERRSGSGVIFPNMFTIKAKVVSVFDDYLDDGKRNSVIEKFRSLFDTYIPLDKCRPAVINMKIIEIECVTHTSNYNKRMDYYFISSLFLLKIEAAEGGWRDVTLVQKSLAGAGRITDDAPPPEQFNQEPETNMDIAYVEKELRSKIRTILSTAFPGVNAGEM